MPNCHPYNVDCILRVILAALASKSLFSRKEKNLGRMRTERSCRCEVQRVKQSVHVLYGSKGTVLFDSVHISLGLDPCFICVYITSGWVSMFHNHLCTWLTVIFLKQEIPSLVFANLCEEGGEGPRAWNFTDTEDRQSKSSHGCFSSQEQMKQHFCFEHISAIEGHRPEHDSLLKLGGIKTKEMKEINLNSSQKTDLKPSAMKSS